MAFKGKICSKGIWDESIPGIGFDEDGISNYARIQYKLMEDYPINENGEQKWKVLLEQIQRKGKSGKYDCIVGVSGGTDSSYLLHLAKENNLNPLAVHLDNGFNSEIAVNNIYKLTEALNIDLKTHVVVYEEMKDILRSYMFAGLPWIDNPTDQAIFNVLYKIADKEKIKYILIGDDFRSEGKQPTEWTYSDQKQLNFVHKKFGRVKLKTYPKLSFSSKYWLSLVKKIKMVSPFYYINYNKMEAQQLLINKYKWEYYGEHHHENLFTKWAISYWMYEKFGMDKRKITYSAQVLNKKMSREDALKIINNRPYNPLKIEEEINYVMKKLDLTKEEYLKIWNSPNRSFKDYPSYYETIIKYAKFIEPIINLVLTTKPKMFYEMKERKNGLKNYE
ncbi:MAG: N-acetyl sugar amidotransferase [Bacteroidetes bacterium]|jgi:N-acetyl sugar amidotransferase|nr:N-acetyl sugar amidotransferase [Bacteroidota bacterium]